ncbi:MAG: MaoC family dehydratase [Pseudomonadota bacterium]
MTKANAGNYFEDFTVGQMLQHATPRTLTVGDQALYMALYGPRFAVQSSHALATRLGYRDTPLDDLLVFHTVFGKTVPDISLNAVANLGYAECRFLQPVFPGDTLSARSEVIGVKENSNGKTGVVYVRSTGENQHGDAVLSFVRWVMVNKRSADSVSPLPVVPKLDGAVAASDLVVGVPAFRSSDYDVELAGSPHRWADYDIGERIDHVDGVTLEEAEHQLATRLYQNTAKVHFNQHVQGEGRFGRRLVYGGVVMSLARAIAFNGLGNAFHIAAINGGQHVAPVFAGDTLYAWSKVLDQAECAGRLDIGALRTRLVATKNVPCADFPYKLDDKTYEDGVVLDLDIWLLIPR